MKRVVLGISIIALGILCLSASSQPKPLTQFTNFGFEEVRNANLGPLNETDLSGNTWTNESVKGRVFILNFWATWCGPCVSEMPTIQQFWLKYKNDPRIRLLAVSNEAKSVVASFQKKNSYDFPIVAESDLYDAYKVSAIPTTLIIDPTGKIIAKEVGSFEWTDSDFREAVDSLIATATAAATTPTAAPTSTPIATQASALAHNDADPALQSADYLSQIEKDVIAEMNFAREEPQEYAKIVREYRKLYKGNNVYAPGEPILMTNEGLAPVDELIALLEKQKPIAALSPSKGLSLAAQDHAKDQGKTGGLGHSGSDGSDPFTRMNRYGKWSGTAGENVAYGPTTGRQIVLQLLIDDGVPNRGHRTNIFKADFLLAGVAYGTHKMYGSVCVIDFAMSYKDK